MRSMAKSWTEGDKFIYRINDFYENKSMEHIIFSNTHGRKSKTATAEENTQKLKNVLLTSGQTE